MESRWSWRWLAGRAQPWVDFTVVLLGWLAVLVFTNFTDASLRSDLRSSALAVFAAAVTVALMSRRGLYSGRPTLPVTEEISRLLSSVVIAAAGVAALSALVNWTIGASELLLGVFVTFSLRSATRGLLRSVAASFKAADTGVSVVIVGVGEEARDLLTLIHDHPETRLRCAGVIGNHQVATAYDLADCWLGDTNDMIQVMHDHGVEAAMVTSTGFRGPQFRRLTSELMRAGYDVHLSTGVNRLTRSRYGVRSLSHEPLVVLSHASPSRWQLASKRVLDVVLATIGLAFLSPILLVAALAVKLGDRGPVIFRSERVGMNGVNFTMLKLRSMTIDAEARKAELDELNERTGPLFKIGSDPRITRVGRIIRETSIDELPQLINVLRGQMSLVGPRPALLSEGAAFDDELRARFAVRPGITGLWQVEARSNASFRAYRRLDLHYVENWSLGLDLRIILATIDHLVVGLLSLPLRKVLGVAGIDGVSSTPVEVRPRAATIDLVALDRAHVSADADAEACVESPADTAAVSQA